MNGTPPLATPPAPPRASRAVVAWLLVALAWGLATLPGAVDRPLTRASEARAWAVARTMVESGDWVLPRYQGEARLKKPPLQSWVQAAVMSVAGRTDVALAGLGTWLVGLLFAAGPLLLGRAVGRHDEGLLGSLLLCASRAAVTWGASPEHDVPFAAWTGLSFAALARALAPTGRPRDLGVAALACGAAVLTKGPFALAFVPGTALVLRARADTRGPLRGRVFWPVLLGGAVLPALLWLGAVAARHGSVSAVFTEMATQASGSEGAHTKPFPTSLVYHLGAWAKACLPWSPLALLAAAHLGVLRRRGLARDDGPTLLVPAVAAGVVFVVLTATPAKQEHYVLPLLAPVALAVAHGLGRVGAAVPRAARALPVALLVVGLAYAGSRWWSLRGQPFPVGVSWPAVVAVGLLSALVAWRSLPLAAFVVAAALGLSGACDAARGLAEEDYRASARASELAGDGSVRLVGFARGGGEAFDTLVAWLPGAYERVRSVEALTDALARPGPVAVLVRVSDLADLGGAAAALTRRGTLAPARPGSDRDRVAWFARAR